MTGDDSVRFCWHCNKNVYRLSNITTEQVEALLTQPGPPCVRFDQRSDGTVMTADCPVGARRVRSRRLVAGVGPLCCRLRGQPATTPAAIVATNPKALAASNASTPAAHQPDRAGPAAQVPTDDKPPQPVLLMGDISEVVMGKPMVAPPPHLRRSRLVLRSRPCVLTRANYHQ
jgi:hypothetical protein